LVVPLQEPTTVFSVAVFVAVTSPLFVRHTPEEFTQSAAVAKVLLVSSVQSASLLAWDTYLSVSPPA